MNPLLKSVVLILLSISRKSQSEDTIKRTNVDITFQEENVAESDEKSRIKSDEPRISEEMERQNISLSQRDIYYAGFQVKRAQQLQAAKQLLTIDDYSKQYKMVKILMEKIFQVLASAKLEITQSSYIPGQEFPEKEQELHALAHVVENTAFFGDILLRLPDITHKILKGNKEWEIVINWSVGFCNETGLFDYANEKLLSLVAQELNLVPKDPDYVNPYKAETLLKEAKMKAEKKQENKTKQKKSKRKERKGPRLSRSDL